MSSSRLSCFCLPLLKRIANIQLSFSSAFAGNRFSYSMGEEVQLTMSLPWITFNIIKALQRIYKNVYQQNSFSYVSIHVLALRITYERDAVHFKTKQSRESAAANFVRWNTVWNVWCDLMNYDGINIKCSFHFHFEEHTGTAIAMPIVNVFYFMVEWLHFYHIFWIRSTTRHSADI